MRERILPDGSLPEIIPGEVVLVTPNFRVVTDYKPGQEGLREGERFFIEPASTKAYFMLSKAAQAHNIYNFNYRTVFNITHQGASTALALRADYIKENIPAIFMGIVEIPSPGSDTIPAVQRMDECISNEQFYYNFAPNLPENYGIPNPFTRHLRYIQVAFRDEVPTRIVHSSDRDSYYKVRKNWWFGLFASLDLAMTTNEFNDLETRRLVGKFFAKFFKREFTRSKNLTTASDIAEANALIDKIWQRYGAASK